MKRKKLKIIGWREWVSLLDFNIKNIKAKIDSGARTSSLHAFNMETYKRGETNFVKFYIHPENKSNDIEIECHAEVLEFRKIKSSNGQSELRPVILTHIELLDEAWPIEITLTNRGEMGFRMLLGRQSIRNRFLIDTGRSFYGLKKSKREIQ